MGFTMPWNGGAVTCSLIRTVTVERGPGGIDHLGSWEGDEPCGVWLRGKPALNIERGRGSSGSCRE
jgi:hypothetical protein